MTMRAMVAMAAGLLAATVCGAQQPKVLNAQTSVREHGSLEREVAATKGPEWIGYSVATAREVHMGWSNDTEHLEGGPRYTGRSERKPGDPETHGVVLLRVVDGKVVRVQVSDSSRQLDGGGLAFVWMNDVRATESLAVLQAAVEANPVGLEILGKVTEQDKRSRNVRENGLMAIGLHDAPEATPILQGFTDARYPRPLREKAAFWLANERGREGLEAVSALLKAPGDDAFREQLVFDLTLVQEPAKKAAVEELLNVAKSDASVKVRSKAQFWLAQMVVQKGADDPRVARALGDSAQNDPDAAIRKSAVFALSRLPQEQAAQELIQVASSTRDASTRREAIFWLGQSKDPKALAYLEKVVRE